MGPCCSRQPWTLSDTLPAEASLEVMSRREKTCILDDKCGVVWLDDGSDTDRRPVADGDELEGAAD